MQTFAVGGHGGSGKDTCNSGVRIVHRASGATGRCVDSRSQHKNKAVAFRRMAETKEFKAWHKMTCARLRGQPTVESLVEEALHPKNLLVEVQTGGRWVREK